MERADLDADILAADQELSALLEKHINLPVRKSIEQASGGLSLTLKQDFDANALTLRSELKKLHGTLEELSDDLGQIRHVSTRVETMVQRADGAQEGRFEKLSVLMHQSEVGVKDVLAGVEERLNKLGNAQLHHLNSLLKTLAADVQKQSNESRETDQRLLEKLDEIASTNAAHASREIELHRASNGRFFWVLVGLSVNFAALLVLLAKSFLPAGT